MKKLAQNKVMSLVVAFAVLFSLAVAPIRAFAADTSVDAKVAEAAEAAQVEMESAIAGAEDVAVPTEIQPRAHVSYYPSSGVSSGYFNGAYSRTATYTSLPSGTMQFSYSMSGGGNCYLLFYRGTSASGSALRSVALNANDYTGSSSIYLPVGGSYTVQVYYPNGKASTEIIYAFNLYRE